MAVLGGLSVEAVHSAIENGNREFKVVIDKKKTKELKIHEMLFPRISLASGEGCRYDFRKCDEGPTRETETIKAEFYLKSHFFH